MLGEGKARVINGDEYLIIFDHNEMETLCRDGFVSVFFPNLNILLPLGKLKNPSRRVIERDGRLSFNGVIFAKEPGFIQPIIGVKGIFAKLHTNTLVFQIDKNGKLIGVTFK